MNNKINPKKGEVDTTKKQNVSRFADKTISGKGGKVNTNTIVSVNHDVVSDTLYEKMPAQVQILIKHIDMVNASKGVCSIDDIMPDFDSYGYDQDAVQVLGHYLTYFKGLAKGNKTYKGYDSATLSSIFITA